MTRRSFSTSCACALLSALALAAPIAADGGLPQPPAGTPPNTFATTDTGCLGALRSLIASGQLAGVTLPDGFVIPAGFSGSFNPGDHFGTVAEAAFLTSHGVTDLNAFCALFVK